MANIIFAQDDQIHEFDTLAAAFFDALLGLDYAECFVSDCSTLSDFSGEGAPELIYQGMGTPALRDRAWDAWILAEIHTRYGVLLPNTLLTLVDLFNQISQARASTVH